MILRKAVSCLLFVLCHLSSAATDLSAGDPCIQNTGGQGICKRLRDCPKAVEKIQSGVYPKLCSYEGLLPVVCCPTAQNFVSDRLRGKKSREKCQYYGSLIVHEDKDPVLLPNAPLRNITDCSIPDKAVEQLVIGGKDAKLKEFPHMAILGYGPRNNIEWRCGGSLISERYVLTAAHCFSAGSKGKVRWVRLGDLDIYNRTDGSEPADYEVVDTKRHQSYSYPSHYDDIGLLKLDRDVVFTSFIRPACINSEYDILETVTIATGWGLTDNDNNFGSSILQRVTLNILDTSLCNQTFRGLIGTNKLRRGIDDSSQMCIGDLKENKDTCSGDSGGPAQYILSSPECMYNLIAVTSFGSLICGARRPAVYTRVSNYVPWIESIVWPN